MGFKCGDLRCLLHCLLPQTPHDSSTANLDFVIEAPDALRDRQIICVPHTSPITYKIQRNIAQNKLKQMLIIMKNIRIYFKLHNITNH